MIDDGEQDMPPTAPAARPGTGTVTVVIVDDHLLVADAVSSGLRAHDRVSVLAVAATCADGLTEVGRHRPDVCLLDQRLPDGLGTDLVPHLLAASPGTKVLLVTGDDSIDLLHQALAAGAVGIVSKSQRSGVLHDAVLRAAEGHPVLSDRDLRRLLPSAGRDARHLGDDLTPRERDVLRLLAQGMSTRDISGRLSISYATVRNHIQSLMAKLGAHTKLEAVTIALREKIVSGP